MLKKLSIIILVLWIILAIGGLVCLCIPPTPTTTAWVVATDVFTVLALLYFEIASKYEK